MLDNKPIELNEYGTAIFLAIQHCGSGNRPYNISTKYIPYDSTVTIYGKEIACKKLKPNPNYIPETDEERDNRIKEHNKKIYNWLKENYPDKDYAERFIMENK